jgi:hypothetical protein
MVNMSGKPTSRGDAAMTSKSFDRASAIGSDHKDVHPPYRTAEAVPRRKITMLSDRRREVRERRPGQDTTHNGLKDSRVEKRKIREAKGELRDTQVGYRGTLGFVKEIKAAALKDDLTLFGYAQVTHSFRQKYRGLEALLELHHVKRRRTIDQDRLRRVDHPLGCDDAAPRPEARSAA